MKSLAVGHKIKSVITPRLLHAVLKVTSPPARSRREGPLADPHPRLWRPVWGGARPLQVVLVDFASGHTPGWGRPKRAGVITAHTNITYYLVSHIYPHDFDSSVAISLLLVVTNQTRGRSRERPRMKIRTFICPSSVGCHE